MTFVPALLGGILIGLAAVLFLLLNGRILGISGIVGGLFPAPQKNELGWRLSFLFGLISGGVLLQAFYPLAFGNNLERSQVTLVIAGLLVGYGTRLGGGCTSGHGVCGMGRLSPRSFLATLVFMGTGIVTVYLFTHL